MHIVAQAAVQGHLYLHAGTVHQFLALADIDEAAADKIRTGQHLAGGTIHSSRHDDDAILGQVVAVTQDHIAHIAHAVAIHHDGAGGNGVLHGHAVGRQADVLAVLGDINVLLRDIAQVLGRLGVALELLELTVHGQEVLRVRQGQHKLLFFLAGVARNMGVVHVLVDDLGAQSQQAVDDLGNGLFVAGDGTGRDDDKVVGADLDLTVAGLRHAGQRRQRLALAAGGNEHDLFRRVLVDLLDGDQHIVRGMQVPQFAGHLGVGDHAAAADGHLAARLNGQVDDLLHAVDV